MTEILILYNFFLDTHSHIPQLLTKIINKYDTFRLKIFVHSLKKRHGKNIKVRIINAKENLLVMDQSIKFELFSDIRLEIDQIEYLKIRQETTNITIKNLILLFESLKKLGTFNIQNIFIPKILEFGLIYYFNDVFGKCLTLSNIIQKGNYHRIILFNFNKTALSLFKNNSSKFGNLTHVNDKFLSKREKLLRILNISCYIITLLGSFFKRRMYEKRKERKNLSTKLKNSILFVIKSKNQFNSVKSVFNNLYYQKNQNAIYYYVQYFTNFRDFGRLIRFLNEKRKNIIDYKKEILTNLSPKSGEFECVIKMFYNSHFYTKLILLFNFYNNLDNFIDKNLPSLVVISNDFDFAEKIAADYFRLKNIPTLYIPHSAIPIIPELITKYDIKYYALGGEADKKYYVKRGIPEKNIMITGIPRYQYIYENNVKQLESIQDMFDGRTYDLRKKGLKILLTTNPIDDKSNNKIINSVINSLTELNLVNNLIIKLHPSESGILHKEIIQKLKIKPVIVKDYNILELIKSVDLLISQMSTTLLEAMIIGTPMILLNFINIEFEKSSTYEFLNFINTVKKQDLLTQGIKEILEYKDKKEFLNQKNIEYSKKFSYYDVEQPPTEKIVNFILKLIENNNPTV